MSSLTQTDEAIFEREVRRIAKELFPKASVTGPTKLDGRERDGVYADGETIHIIEATVSGKQAKAATDLNKSADLGSGPIKVLADQMIG